MFWFIVDILTLRRFGLGKPFRYVVLLIWIGVVIAGLIYAFAVFHAVEERSVTPHVQQTPARH